MSETTDMLRQHMDNLTARLVLCQEHENGLDDDEHDRDECEVCQEQDHDDDTVLCGMRYMDDLPLELVEAIGTPYAVVFCTGGPHIEIVHDTREGGARLEGYWGGEKVVMRGPVYQWACDYYFDR